MNHLLLADEILAMSDKSYHDFFSPVILSQEIYSKGYIQVQIESELNTRRELEKEILECS